jgi:hypothetical protein
MRLMEYQKSEASDLVDAVFLENEERFWHLQLVDATTPPRVGAGPCIQFKPLDKPPRIGAVAEGYRRLQYSGTTPMLMENTWLKLMLAAMDNPSGADAILEIAL